MSKSARLFITLLLTWIIVSAAHAQHLHRDGARTAIVVCDQRGCSDHTKGAARNRVRLGANALDANGNAAVIGGRPPGCPPEFCGCEASLYVFGEIRRELNLASAWMRKFPRTQPATGMAAVRNHHVMILMRQIVGKDWLVHDGNSGDRLTREHVRSIAGYIIVDPHGSHAASAAN